jgi:hypothetical protein
MTQLLRRVVTIDWPKGAEREAKSLLIRTARTGHQRIMADAATKGFVPSWDAYANTPGNRDLASVKLPGPIVYNYRYLSDLIQTALDELRKASPVQSGDYVRSHALYVNDTPVDVLPRNLKEGDRVYIANPVPYARKIEVGKTKTGRPFVIQVKPRIYERVAEKLKEDVRGRSRVRMGYVDLAAHYLTKDQPSRRFNPLRHSQLQRQDRVKGSVVQSPALFFTLFV